VVTREEWKKVKLDSKSSQYSILKMMGIPVTNQESESPERLESLYNNIYEDTRDTTCTSLDFADACCQQKPTTCGEANKDGGMDCAAGSVYDERKKDTVCALADAAATCCTSLAELKQVPAADLKTKGFTAKELREADFTLAQLKEAGFTAKELREADFTVPELRLAGFTEDAVREALGFEKVTELADIQKKYEEDLKVAAAAGAKDLLLRRSEGQQRSAAQVRLAERRLKQRGDAFLAELKELKEVEKKAKLVQELEIEPVVAVLLLAKLELLNLAELHTREKAELEDLLGEDFRATIADLEFDDERVEMLVTKLGLDQENAGKVLEKLDLLTGKKRPEI
jgi:hypothetical protein